MTLDGAVKKSINDICDMFVLETLSTPEGKIHKLRAPREICVTCRLYDLEAGISYCRKDISNNAKDYSENYEKISSS